MYDFQSNANEPQLIAIQQEQLSIKLFDKISGNELILRTRNNITSAYVMQLKPIVCRIFKIDTHFQTFLQ